VVAGNTLSVQQLDVSQISQRLVSLFLEPYDLSCLAPMGAEGAARSTEIRVAKGL